MDPASFATAYGLSTSIGLRPFLTLALASLALHLGYLHVAPAFAALGSDGAAWLFAALAVLEFVADKVPVVDHGLHALHFGIKPVAAALLVGGALGSATGEPDALTYAAMGLAALNALGVHAGVTALRGASTAMTLGFANPFVSVAEDVVASGTALLAIALPFVGAAVAVVLCLAAFAVFRIALSEVRRRRVPAGTAVAVRPRV
jgi:hypothetical protein